MQIQRIEMEQIRRFREPVLIENLEPGINLFVGPNEVGKSSMVRAIRAAFLERYRSNKVEDLSTWGVHNAAPKVRILFLWQNQQCILEKQFLAKKSCSLQIGDQFLQGEDAEDRLAALMGFTLAAKGGIRDEQLGIPGVLWIEQGKGHELEDAVRASADHLRAALPESMESLGSRYGDAVASAVARQLGDLQTATGRPRGEYLALLNEIDALQTNVAESRRLIGAYREQVDELGLLRTAHRQDVQNKPWMQMRSQAEAIQGRLKAAMQCKTDLKSLENEVDALHSRVELLNNHQKQRESAEKEVVEIAEKLAARQIEAETIAERLNRLRVDESQAKAAWESAKTLEQSSRNAHEIRAMYQESDNLRGYLAKGIEALAQARQCETRLVDTQTRLNQQRLEESDLMALRTLDREYRENQIRLEHVATKMIYRLDPGVQMQIGDTVVEGSGEWTVSKSVQVQMPGVGMLQISPGDEALSDLDQKQHALQHQIAMKLADGHVDSLSAAEILWAAIQRDRAQVEQDAFLVKSMAPEGVDTLARQVDGWKTRLDEITESLSNLPTEPASALTLEEAREARETAERAWSLQSALFHECAKEQAGLNSEIQLLESNQHKLVALVQETDVLFPQWIVEKRTLESAQGDNLLKQNRLREQLALEDPEILQQDAERFANSAKFAEEKHRDRADRMGRLEVQLEVSGAQGLEERLAEQEALLSAKERWVQRFKVRVQGLALLSGLLEGHRDALLQKLQAPLQARVDHYLRLWSPGARLRLGTDLEPVEILRERGLLGIEPAPFSALSFGAREQVALLMRLAYADVLKEVGRPTLIILDDVLAHSDAVRLDFMKRILNDAAKRHQILLLTCHEEDWTDLGVPSRSVGSL